ncbi:MAG: hypothetical protein JO348_08360 [Alphaproteobacteria bacterium]|nr:hypothetical protein [Alphaproteobacteria bacterium]
MSKIGVGVGDEFPVDDGAPKPNSNAGAFDTGSPQDDRAEFEAWKARRDAYRAQREAWRAQREEWHRRKAEWKAQWHEQKRAWREDMRARYGDDYAYNYGGRRYGRGRFPLFFGGWGVYRLVMLFLVIALLIFAISHIGYILAGLAAVAILFAAWHHFGHDPFDLPYANSGRDYSRPMTTPPPPNTAPNSTNNLTPPAPPAA